MAEKYGTAEQATLFALLLRGPEISNPDLKQEHGIELKPLGREKLNRAGLLDTNTKHRPFLHRITPAGVAWCEEALATMEPPPRASGLVRVAFELLRLYVAYARRKDISLADVLQRTTTDTLEDLIRRAYGELSSRPQEWVRLAQLRPKLNGADKSEVDEELLEMIKTGLVHLSPDSDRRNLTEADHAAAIRIGKEDKHLVAIEEA
jgi:hypothetical protein